jgi:hypothetical protein
MAGLFSRPRLLRHRVAITCGAGPGKNRRNGQPEILDERPGPEAKAKFTNRFGCPQRLVNLSNGSEELFNAWAAPSWS